MSFDGEPRPCDDFNIAVPYTILQEFPLQPQLLSVIPHQAQKMLHTLDIIFTCIDISKEYIAIGSNIGIVYLYDRINDKILKLRNQDYTDAVTCVRIVVSLECMVICGSMKGSVTVFKVPFTDVNEMEKFTVIGFHHTNITSLECSNNGMKFFSGDSSGLVVCTDVNHLEHYSMSRVILSETDEIVQMSYTSMMLLVSTLQKTIIYHFKENQCIQVGQKLRKCPGNFGAIFCNEDRNILYASRPGQRIWKAGFNGVIIETLILKDALSKPHQHITLLQSEDNAMKKQENFQFGQLLMFHRQYLLTWSANMLVLIHPQLRAVVASCCFVDKIVNVAVHNDEIFILQGTRKLRRIALHPEDAVISETSGSSDMLEGFLKPLEKFQQSTLPSKEELTKVFHWFKNKLHDTFVDEEKNVSVFEEKEMIDLSPKLPDIIKLDSDDCLPLQFNANAAIAPKENKGNMEIIENDEIVFKPKKKKNKKNRKGNTSEGSKSIPKKQILNDELNTYTLSTTIVNDSENVKLCVLEPTLNYNENSQSLIETAKTGDQLSDEGNYEKYEIYQLTTVDQLESPTVESINENELNSSSKAFEYSNVVDTPSSHDGIYSKTQVCSDTELAVEDAVNEHCMFDKDYSENSYPDGNNIELSVSMNSMDSSDCDIPRYGMDWVEYKAPGSLLCISISKNHIFCVDSNDKLYISDFSFLGLSWQEISRPANQVAVSPSGKIIWVLYKGSAYAACGQSKNLSEDGEWVVAARNISYIAVDDDCAWYISDCGKLITQQCLSASNPCSYPVEVPCPWTISQVACHGDVVWIVVAEGKLYYRAGITEKNKIGFSWKQIKSPQISYVSSIALSSYKTGWIVDGTGRIWFRIGVSNSMPDGVTTLWEAEGSEYLFQSYSQVHKAMSKVISGERLSNFIYGQRQVCITAGEVGVWFFKTYENLLHANQGIVIGHSWDVIVPKGTASSSKWSILSARNLSKSLGCVWCASNTGELFCFSTLSNEPIAVEMPPESTIQCLETNPESVWLLTRKGDIYIRKELNERHSQGIWWQKLNLNQLANVRLTHISCSSEIVWACGDNGKVYARVGTLNPSSGACLSQAWLSLDSNVSRPPVIKKHSMIGKQFPLPIMNSVRKKSSVIVKVYVGHKPYVVWALDDMQNTYVRDGVSSSMLFGESWVYVPGLHAKELCISNATVWALKPSGKIFRRFGITENNLSGDYWKQIPGKLTHLSVTVDDEIWGLKEESIFCHSSFPLQYCKSSAKKLSGSVSEDDWEDIVQSVEFN